MLLKHILPKTTCINWVLITVLTGLIATGCSTPIQPNDDTRVDKIEASDSLEALMSATKKAELLASPQREEQLIIIATKLFSIGELQQAKNIIEITNTDNLNNPNYIAHNIIAGRIYLEDRSLYKAKQLLTNEKLKSLIDQFSIEQERQYHQARATLYSQIGEAIISLNERIALGTLLFDTTDINNNNNLIWQYLSKLTYSELITLQQDITDSILKGWFELAAVSKQYQGSLQLQNTAILNWSAENPNHPASQQLPADLALLQDLIQTRPNNIALLLPFNGKLAKAGKAIRDGFLAAYYHNKSTQQNNPTVTLYDTSSESINTLYDRAMLNGADIIIGPLSKDKVNLLQQRPSLPVPTLALNYLEKDTSTSDTNEEKPLYQFGLSLEDEAVQVADRAWLEGHRQVLIMSSKANWSQRVSDAFITRWQEYGGIIIDNSHLNDSTSYSETIENILNIDRSHQRANELKRLFGMGFEFEPRRRADIDMIFLVARQQEGRQIKPTLNFQYAADIPVYATSQIYSSSNSKNKNSDLNNIRLTTLPWLLNTATEEKNLIDNNINVSAGYERLYALGVDSFLLYPRLQQLYRLGEQQLYGATGQLSIDKQKRVVRKQLWAKISRGELHPLRTLMLSSDNAL
jgi:outer membrane PBP1 activator LpoA protein